MGRLSLWNQLENAVQNACFVSFIPVFFCVSTEFRAVFFPNFSPCVTLVTAKNQHRCWKARAYTRTWERKAQRGSVLSSTLCKTMMQKNILSLFPWFFPLWGYIDPYIFRDAIKLCAPNLQFHFHGESQSKILNPNRSLDRYSVAHYGEDNFLSSFIFSLASCCSFVLDVARYGFGLTNNHRLNNPLKSVRELMTEWG